VKTVTCSRCRRLASWEEAADGWIFPDDQPVCPDCLTDEEQSRIAVSEAEEAEEHAESLDEEARRGEFLTDEEIEAERGEETTD
jgi:hypothetical protein